MIKVGIVGTSGYAGQELMRLLMAHPEAEVVYVASTSKVGEKVGKALPSFDGFCDLAFEPVDAALMGRQCDVVFTATPHGVASGLGEEILAQGAVLIDIGSDFRFDDIDVYAKWYGMDHTAPQLAKAAVYGLVELFRARIKEADLIANPGCYPTSATLALAPLVKEGWIDPESIVVSSMSGVSGAGVTPKPMYHFPDCVENAQGYGMPGHRHTPEIERALSLLIGKSVPPLSFTPHLVPMSRGILTHANAKAVRDVGPAELIDLYLAFYDGAPFVRVLSDRLAQTKAVLGTNLCDIAPRVDERTGRILVESAIDNLGKGAAGQAIQNMNVRFGLDERAGLWAPAVTP